MATYGQLNTNTVYDSYFWVKWSQASQDIAANKTKINWSCGVYCGHSFYSNAIKMSAVKINGVQVYGGGTYSNFYSGDHTIASGTLEISHGTDGKKTFSISSFTGWLYSSYNYSSNGGSFDLTTIPRQATITAAADFKDVDNPSISFSNPGGFKMDVWLEPNPVGDHLCVRTGIPNTGKYTWTLTDEERDQLRNKCPGTECTIRLGLYTYIGNTTYADYKDKKFTMTENAATKPSVSMDITIDNGQISEEYDGLCIQGKSKVSVKLSAEPKYGASIKSYASLVDFIVYQSSEFLSDVIQTSGDVEILGSAKDSRGFTGYTDRVHLNVIPYSKPLVIPLASENAIQCYRSDGNGNRTGGSTSLWIKAKRTYSDLAGMNVCKLQWRWKLASEAWNDAKHTWSTLLDISRPANAEYNALVPGEFALEKAYTVQIRAIDDIRDFDIKTFDIPTRDVALHLGKGGKNVAIGTYCDYSEEHTFYSEWKAIFDKDVLVGGNVLIGEEKTPLRDYILSVINGGG